MKQLFKSFFITLFITIFLGFGMLFLMNFNLGSKSKNELSVQTEISKKANRQATKDDVLNILQLINLKNKKIISEIVINPISKNVEVNRFNSSDDFNNDEVLGKIYDYGGVNYLLKKINQKFNKKINKYIVINGRENLEQILDAVGNLKIKKELYDDLKNSEIGIKYFIMDGAGFLKLIEYDNNFVLVNKIIKQYFVKKLPMLKTEIGEKTFKEIINLVDSNISYRDYKNLTEINLEDLK